MKKPHLPSHTVESTRRSLRDHRASGSATGRWEFNLTGERLFALGSSESIRHVAYRTAAGEMRFLPF